MAVKTVAMRAGSTIESYKSWPGSSVFPLAKALILQFVRLPHLGSFASPYGHFVSIKCYCVKWSLQSTADATSCPSHEVDTKNGTNLLQCIKLWPMLHLAVHVLSMHQSFSSVGTKLVTCPTRSLFFGAISPNKQCRWLGTVGWDLEVRGPVSKLS